MSEKTTPGKKKQESKKQIILHEITERLSAAFSSLKESLGEKKFAKRIKKAAKLLSDDSKTKRAKKIAPAIPAGDRAEKVAKKTVTPKKVAKKTPAPKKAAKKTAPAK